VSLPFPFRWRRPVAIVKSVTTAAALLALSLLAGCSSAPKSAAPAAASYSFWPPAPDEPHIQYLTTINSSDDVAPKRSGFDDMVYGRDVNQTHYITKPYGVRMWNGRIYVCDVRARGIAVFDLRKQQTRIMGVTGAGIIQKAVDLAITPDGTKYVADQGQRAVVVFDPDERFVGAYPLGDVQIVGIAVHNDTLYVVDYKNSHVKVLDRHTGVQQRVIGQRGGGDGNFVGPLAVACDADGNVYVSDTVRACIQKFSPTGEFLLAFGETGNRPGNFVRPKHMGVGSDGHIHVFDSEGRVVGYYGSNGPHPGAMDLPAGLHVHEADFDLFESFVHPAFQVERLILVTNQFGPRKISVYAMGHLKEGKTVADIASGRINVLAGTVPATTQPVARQEAGD
jgi:sugar lactone lactonase YvrE